MHGAHCGNRAALLAVAVLLVAVAVTLPEGVRADTPASCMFDQVQDRWRFHMGPGGGDNTVNCSVPFAEDSYYEVALYFPDVAVDTDGNFGFWTMIYNQGFEVQITGRKFFAFSYYVQDGSNVTSYCDRTFPGWYHNDDGTNWGCYYGLKIDGTGAGADAAGPKVLETRPKELETIGAQLYVPDADFVQRLNAAQTSWVAGDYPHYHGKTLAQLTRQRAGGPLATRASRPSMPANRHSRDRLSRLSVVEAPHEAPISKGDPVTDVAIPAAFDWRNVSGVNFVSPVRDQQHCGSCYAFSSMAMLEARIRIATGNAQQPVLAPQDVVSCSEYAQGCSGGFPYLTAGKYAEDFGVVDESCFPYTGTDATPCAARCTNPARRYRSTDYQYIGGFYGACNEAVMQREMLLNGPIVVGFQDFHFYQGGVYQHTGLTSTFNPFEPVSHAVLVVGWDVTPDGLPYWIVKNSWSEKWGENGYFRIVRGVDECGIESIGVAAKPVL